MNPFIRMLKLVGFHKLKEAVSTLHVFALPDFTLLFIIECDGFGLGLGAILMQYKRPIAFHHQTLKGKSLHLSTYKRELLPLVVAVKN